MATGRKNIMLGTAGHVDHGKTALVKLLTGCDTDTLAEEKQRGLTIDLGFAPCKMADERIVGIVDVPGHVDFVRNMVAGAQSIDVVIFVVAADDGVMPQTREHLDILGLMGVRHGLVALTKIDMVDAELRDMAVADVRKLLEGTFLQDAPICPLSNITGEGFDAFFAALNQVADACTDREVSGLFRMWVEDVFSIHGFGTVVTGIPASGEVRVGDRLTLLPDGTSGRVREMQVYGEVSPVGRAGECVAINLSDIDHRQFSRGKVLCQGEPAEPVNMAEANLQLLPWAQRPLKDYAEVHLHVGTGEAMARVAILEGKDIVAGNGALVQLRLDRPLALAAGERFVVRVGVGGPAGGHLTTLGGGRILGTSNTRLKRNRPWTNQALAARRDALDDPAAWCLVHLREAGASLSDAALAQRAAMTPANVAKFLQELVAGKKVLQTPAGKYVARDVIDQVAANVVRTLEEFHAAQPTRVGLTMPEIIASLQADSDLVAMAVAALRTQGKLQAQGDLLMLAGRGVNLSAQDQQLYSRIEAALQAAHLAPPSPQELAVSLAAPPARIDAMIRLLADQGVVARLDDRVVMHRQAIQAAQKVLLELFAKASGFETVQFRDALGVSRKFAVPLLDYFDTIRWTVRSASRRTPGVEARKAMQK